MFTWGQSEKKVGSVKNGGILNLFCQVMTMPSAEIITIGTEILLGEIVDTNSQFIARALRDIGMDVFRTVTVGDNIERIAVAIRESLTRCELIITTGGLGPTVDDPTREAVAKAVGVNVEYLPELWGQIRAQFKKYGRLPTENNKRQAYIPVGAHPVENPVGTAPAFIFELEKKSIVCLPGVPSEMEYLIENSIVPYLRERFELKSIIKSRVIHTVGVGESQIDSLISQLETYSNPTVGLAAHSGQVDIRITAKAENVQAADSLISPIETLIRNNLGEWVYGADQETLEEVAIRGLHRKKWTLVVVEANLGGLLIHRLSSLHSSYLGGEALPNPVSKETLYSRIKRYKQITNADVCLGVTLHLGHEKNVAHLVLITPEDEQQITIPYGGPPEYAARWAFHHSLDMLRGI
jgi:nicotinamide-nucleotide amidase